MVSDRESKSKISLNNSGYTRTISVVSLRGFKTNDIQIFYYWSVIKLCVERFPHFQYSHTSRRMNFWKVKYLRLELEWLTTDLLCQVVPV